MVLGLGLEAGAGVRIEVSVDVRDGVRVRVGDGARTGVRGWGWGAGWTCAPFRSVGSVGGIAFFRFVRLASPAFDPLATIEPEDEVSMAGMGATAQGTLGWIGWQEYYRTESSPTDPVVYVRGVAWCRWHGVVLHGASCIVRAARGVVAWCVVASTITWRGWRGGTAHSGAATGALRKVSKINQRRA